MLQLIIISSGFKKIIETYNIRMYIDIRMINRISDACLSSQVHNHIEMVCSKKIIYQTFISNIPLYPDPFAAALFSNPLDL